MRSSEVESETLYAALGLHESSEIAGYPKVLQLLSSLLENSIQKNRFRSTRKKLDVITVFHGSRSPSLTIRQYLERIFRYSKCSTCCYVVAYVYIQRFLRKMDALLTPLNVHRLLITSIMLAAKFLDDEYYNNGYYAKVGGVSTTEMNRMEMNFLFNLDFRLHVTLEEFTNYCFHLQRESGGDHHIHAWPPRPTSQKPSFAGYSRRI
ncbi:Cyclin family protein [Euphorbia peplus]|nr:Cyclin family protein [Euphorbia peplus]